MKQFILLLLLLTTSLSAASQQNTVGLINIKAGVSDGYTLFSPVHSTQTYLIDNCGRVINEWTSEYPPGSSVYLGEDGNLVRTLKNSNPAYLNPKGPGGGVEIFSWNGDLIWTFFYNTGDDLQHHDIALIPNGNILLLAWDLKNFEESVASGRDPESLPDNEIWSEQVIEVNPNLPAGEQIVWRWNLWDHLVQDFDDSKENFGSVQDQPGLVDINYFGDGQDADWIHANSMDYNSELDQIMIGSRDFNEFWIIDHSTTTEEASTHSGGDYGRGGDLLYRWGNPATYKKGDILDRKLFGQHDVHWISEGLEDEGKVMIFNNGFGRVTEYSSVDILEPQIEDGEYMLVDGVFQPTELDWQYQSGKATNFYSFFMSGAQRLQTGGTLICSTAEGKIFEIDSKNEIVWTYRNPNTARGILNQGDVPLIGSATYDNYIFRATKYPPLYPAFDGKDLTPGQTIESGESSVSCDVTLSYSDNHEIIIYPNPVQDFLSVKGVSSFSIMTTDGKVVYKHSSRNSELLSIPVSNWTGGMYFLIMNNSEKIKFLKN